MKFAQINSQLVVLEKLFKQDLPFKASYRIKKLVESLEREAVMFEKMRLDLLKKFAKVDANGELVKDENSNAMFEEGQKDAFQKAFTDMALTDVDIIWTPIPVDLLENANLSANEITIISELIQE